MARPRKTLQQTDLLAAALEGLQAQKQRIDDQIAEVMAMMGKRRGRPPKALSAAASSAPASSGDTMKPASGRKPLSAAARKRIAAAQKKRWAAYRKEQAGGAAA